MPGQAVHILANPPRPIARSSSRWVCCAHPRPESSGFGLGPRRGVKRCIPVLIRCSARRLPHHIPHHFPHHISGAPRSGKMSQRKDATTCCWGPISLCHSATLVACLILPSSVTVAIRLGCTVGRDSLVKPGVAWDPDWQTAAPARLLLVLVGAVGCARGGGNGGGLGVGGEGGSHGTPSHGTLVPGEGACALICCGPIRGSFLLLYR